MKKQNLKISNRFGKDAKNNRLDSKHGTSRKWSAAYRHTGRNICNSFKKMKPKNEAYHIPRIEKSDCTIK
jgi:hypothetical protein